ncbi:hypothetical protein KSS87_020377 [Heliosperma pusillum]|nr:hypothetical protein KSS87_023547 [Heliosperma pusillum]KAH9625957.1 hypothetical protein KSS87_020377 [Heliosperma pusillum]
MMYQLIWLKVQLYGYVSYKVKYKPYKHVLHVYFIILVITVYTLISLANFISI